jgi:segregation and condensation protein A
MTVELNHPYKIDLEVFEGPLDLLLHLIKKSELDIINIPISLILDQYMEHLSLMEELNIDLAGDFLLMASELAHIKSRMLLPVDEQSEDSEADGEDPRAELIRRLLEYQRYKDAARELSERPMLGRDVFQHGVPHEDFDEEESLEADLFQLLSCFHELLQNAPKHTVHQVRGELLSVTDRIYEIMAMMKEKEVVEFRSLFETDPGREAMIVTFLAILEMGRLKMLKITQTEERREIYLRPCFESVEITDLAGSVTLQ